MKTLFAMNPTPAAPSIGNRYARCRAGLAYGIVLLACLLSVAAADEIEQLALIVTDKELFAYSDVGGQWQSLRLQAQEQVRDSKRAERVAIVVTNFRVLGFSALTSKWAERRLEAGETVNTVAARGAVGTVVTSDRMLAFGASNGIWAAQRIPVRP